MPWHANVQELPEYLWHAPVTVSFEINTLSTVIPVRLWQSSRGKRNIFEIDLIAFFCLILNHWTNSLMIENSQWRSSIVADRDKIKTGVDEMRLHTFEVGFKRKSPSGRGYFPFQRYFNLSCRPWRNNLLLLGLNHSAVSDIISSSRLNWYRSVATLGEDRQDQSTLLARFVQGIRPRKQLDELLFVNSNFIFTRKSVDSPFGSAGRSFLWSERSPIALYSLVKARRSQSTCRPKDYHLHVFMLGIQHPDLILFWVGSFPSIKFLFCGLMGNIRHNNEMPQDFKQLSRDTEAILA